MHHYVRNTKNTYSRFSSNSEVKASESLVNLEDKFPHYKEKSVCHERVAVWTLLFKGLTSVKERLLSNFKMCLVYDSYTTTSKEKT